MSRRKGYTARSAIFPAIITLFALAVEVGRELTGARKYGPSASPKSLVQVAAQWPKLLGLATVLFLGSWWWQASKKKPLYVICRTCQDVYEEDEVPFLACPKCKGGLEDLEGFYERHPELNDRVTGSGAETKYDMTIYGDRQITCPGCDRTFLADACPGPRCPDCLTALRP